MKNMRIKKFRLLVQTLIYGTNPVQTPSIPSTHSPSLLLAANLTTDKTASDPPPMVGVAAGFALPQAVSRRPKPAVSASSFACFPAKPWPCSRSRPRPRPRAAARLVVSARYSSSYGDYDDEEVDEDEEFGGGRGGGWGRRDRRADADYDPALDIDRIESSTVRLLDEQKRMVGVVSVNEAIQVADDRDLILAILSVDGDPPVLRLFEEKEYKKHKYEQQKKKRIQQKRSVANRMSLKELKMGYNIDIHDYTVRLKAAKKFLKAGDKVKIIVNLKGRENLYKNTAIELIKRFQKDLGELATEESKNFMERNIYMVLVPNKVAIQKEQTELNKKESVTEDRLEEGGASLMDQQEGTEPVTEQLEENKNSATEVSANI